MAKAIKKPKGSNPFADIERWCARHGLLLLSKRIEYRGDGSEPLKMTFEVAKLSTLDMIAKRLLDTGAVARCFKSVKPIEYGRAAPKRRPSRKKGKRG